LLDPGKEQPDDTPPTDSSPERPKLSG